MNITFSPTGIFSTELVECDSARGTLRAAAPANNLPVTGTGTRRPPFRPSTILRAFMAAVLLTVSLQVIAGMACIETGEVTLR